jgi:hypothetical protein
MPTFSAVDPFPERDGEHLFGVWDCGSEAGSDLVDELAAEVRELYVEPERLRAALETALSDAGEGAGIVALKQAIQRVTEATIPEPLTHAVPQLDLARNEVAEVIANLALTAIHGSVVPASRIRHKEISGSPSRGRDILALDADPLMAVVGEVKASADEASPPSVVDTGESSLRAQLLRAGADSRRLDAELNWALKHAPPEYKMLVAKAIVAHVAGDLPIVVAPVLVRPRERHGINDFGSFREDPGQFEPACVRFCLLRVDGTLEDLANAVYERAHL